MGRKERLLVEVSEYLKQLHAEEPRPSFDEACAEIRAAATDPEDGTYIGIDNGESDDITDEAMQDLPGWDEDWPCDAEYAGEESDECSSCGDLGDLASMVASLPAGVKLGESGGGFLSCACGATTITIPTDCKSILRYQCCCVDCRKGLAVFGSRGAPPPPRVPDLVYFPNILHVDTGRENLRCFVLKAGFPTRRLVATCCWTTLLGDHPAYGGVRFVAYNGPAKLQMNGVSSDDGRITPLQPVDSRIYKGDMAPAELAALPPFRAPADAAIFAGATWASATAAAEAMLAKMKAADGRWKPKYGLFRLETVQQLIASLPTGVEVADPNHDGPTPSWLANKVPAHKT